MRERFQIWWVFCTNTAPLCPYVSLLLLILLVPAALSAQSTIPLTGPLVAVSTAEQDRIILYDLGGNSTIRTLSFGAGWHYVWGFSADGCRIVFTLSDRTAPARLYSARLDGRDVRKLVEYDALPPAQWGVWEPQPSPDGTRIAFTMIRDQPQRSGKLLREYHIAWVDPLGGEPQFYSVTGREHSPQWSPDGQWLAYISYDKRVPGADIFSTAVPTVEPPPGQPTAEPVLTEEADIWVVSADGQTKYNLTRFPVGSAHDPRWSRDGQLISFVYSPSGNNDTFWMIANRQGAIPTQLSFEWVQVLDTTWLPDSSAILASARNFRAAPENRLWTIPLVGNADTDAQLYLDDAALSYADFPRFSADGRWLALRSAYNLAVYDTLSSEWKILDSDILGNTPPVWSPAGFRGETACG